MIKALLFISALVITFYLVIIGLTSRYRVLPPFTYSIPKDSASILHGKNIARTRGCFDCHGLDLKGDDQTDVISPSLKII